MGASGKVGRMKGLLTGLSLPRLKRSVILGVKSLWMHRLRSMLTALCQTLGIPFTDQMLSWPKGPRESDGIWAPHWYDAVSDSTGFKPYEERPVDLPPGLEPLVEA